MIVLKDAGCESSDELVKEGTSEATFSVSEELTVVQFLFGGRLRLNAMLNSYEECQFLLSLRLKLCNTVRLSGVSLVV